MSDVVVKAVPITPERFAPYGDVIYAAPDNKDAMNDARFDRFSNLAEQSPEEISRLYDFELIGQK